MSKKVVIIEYEDYKAINVLLHDARINLEKTEDSYFKLKVQRKIEEVETILNNPDWLLWIYSKNLKPLK